MSVKLDVLAFGAHPDDVELSCGGTLLKEISLGKKVGIIDLTEGELGTRGSKEIRKKESEAASKLLGLEIRENLGMRDGFFEETEENITDIIKVIRKYQPEIVITNSKTDRHPDHGRGCNLVERATFLSGLVKIDTAQDKWRPNLVLNFIQDRYIKPDIVISIDNFFEKKMEVISCYSSQFFSPNSIEPETPISSKQFIDHLKGRAIQFGREIGVGYAEGFTCSRYLGVKSISDLI